MVAILAGSLALVVGLILLMLPLLASELSRPRDSVWGAVVLLMGLDLVTTAERLRGAPMLAVLCGGLLMVRLGSEVGQSRWRQLSPEEQQRLSSVERWRSSLEQLLAAFLGLVEGAGRVLGGLGAWVAERRRTPVATKRWVRPDAPAPEATEPSEASESAEAQASAGVSGEDAVETVEVASFAEVEELLRDAGSTDKEDRATDVPPGVDAEAPEKADQAGETG